MMFERYTDRARRSIALAQEQGRLLRHAEVDDGHLLLGLAAEGGGVAFKALERAGVTAEGIREAVAATRAPSVAPPTNAPFTMEAKRALERALRESITLGHPYIGTEHLLLGVLAGCESKPWSPATVALRACGALPGDVREAVMTLLRGYEETPAPEEPQAGGDRDDALALVLARLDGIAREIGVIRRYLEVPE